MGTTHHMNPDGHIEIRLIIQVLRDSAHHFLGLHQGQIAVFNPVQQTASTHQRARIPSSGSGT